MINSLLPPERDRDRDHAKKKEKEITTRNLSLRAHGTLARLKRSLMVSINVSVELPGKRGGGAFLGLKFNVDHEQIIIKDIYRIQ
jgi:hypothetical protein